VGRPVCFALLRQLERPQIGHHAGDVSSWRCAAIAPQIAPCRLTIPRLTGKQHILRIEAVIRDETDNRLNSHFGSLRQEQRIPHVDTKISHRVLDLGMTEQYLYRTDITCRPVDHRCLRATKRVSSIFLRAQTDRGHPLVNEACTLPRAHVFCVIDSAREYIVLDRAASPFQPEQKAGSHVARDLELDGTPRLLLNDDRSGSDFRSGDDITDPDLN